MWGGIIQDTEDLEDGLEDSTDYDTIIDTPIGDKDVELVNNCKEIIQNIKQELYNTIVRKPIEGVEGTEGAESLENLHRYETTLYEVGTGLLKLLYGFPPVNNNIQSVASSLTEIVRDPQLSTDARILIENEVRNQFIQYPYTRRSNRNNI